MGGKKRAVAICESDDDVFVPRYDITFILLILNTDCFLTLVLQETALKRPVDEPSSSAGLYFRIFRTFNVTRHTRCHAIALANLYSYNIALMKSFPGSYLFFTAYFAFFCIFRLFVTHFFASRAMSHAELYAPSHCLAIFALFLFISAFFDFFTLLF